MGAIVKAGEGLLKDVGHAIGDVADGVGKIAKGGLDLAKGALTLNPKEAFGGIKEAAGGALETGKGAVDLTPEGLEASAANNLLDGVVSEFRGGDSNGSPATAS